MGHKKDLHVIFEPLECPDGQSILHVMKDEQHLHSKIRPDQTAPGSTHSPRGAHRN